MKIYHKILSTCMLSLILVACVTMQSTQNYPAPRGKALEVGGFYINTPKDQHWRLFKRDLHSLSLAKQGNQPDESYALQIWSIKVPEFESDQAFVNYFLESSRLDTPSERFTQEKHEHEVVQNSYGKCIEFSTIYEDRSAAKQSTNMLSMLLEVVGQVCINPNDLNEVAHIAYSNRYYRGGQDLLLYKKAIEVLTSLRFQ